MITLLSETSTFIDDLSPDKENFSGRVGLYIAPSGERFVIKKHVAEDVDRNHEGLQNEANVLKFLTQSITPSKKITFPHFISFNKKGSISELVMKKVKGRHINTYSQKVQIQGLEEIVDFLTSIDMCMSDDVKKLFYIRTPFWYVIRIFAFAFKHSLYNPTCLLQMVKISYQSLIAGIASIFSTPTYVFTHGGLYNDSILYHSQDKTYALIDWESAHLAHPSAEIATLMIYYHDALESLPLQMLLKKRITSMSDRRMYQLIVSYTILSLEKELACFMQGYSAFDAINKINGLAMTSRQSPYEYIHHSTFLILSKIIKLIPWLRGKSNDVILCYHSIADTGWRYATPVQTFKEHIAYLTSHYTIVPLEQIVSQTAPAGSVAITFDDGYNDVFTNALPILSEYGLVATVFALGSPEYAHVDELENSYLIMNDAQLKKLSRAGWEIGFHTGTHPNLHTLSKVRLKKEIVQSKVEMEKRTGLRLRYFAYPKGKYSDKIIGIVKDGGYTAGFSVDGGRMSLRNAYCIPRLPAEGVLSVDELAAQMSFPGLVISRLYMNILGKKEKIQKAFTSYVTK